jgi:hypothetical protein
MSRERVAMISIFSISYFVSVYDEVDELGEVVSRFGCGFTFEQFCTEGYLEIFSSVCIML